jgi:hypothetical protein
MSNQQFAVSESKGLRYKFTAEGAKPPQVVLHIPLTPDLLSANPRKGFASASGERGEKLKS